MNASLDFPPLTADADQSQAASTEVATVAAMALDIAKIDLTDLALAKFGNWREATNTAKDELAALVLDLTTQSAIDDAISLRNRKIKQPLADARKVAEGLKSKLFAVSKAVNAELPLIEAAWGEVHGAITPRIEAAQKVIDDAKAAAAAKEAARRAAHEAGISTIRNYLARCQEPGMTAERIAAGIALLGQSSIGPEWEDFQGRALAAQVETLQSMRELHAQAVAREAEAHRQEAIRLENERVARELAAERKRLAEEAAELRRQLAEQAADLKRQADEQARIAAQQAEDARVAALARQREEQAAAESARMAAATAAKNTEAQLPQQVLKAEPVTADATDRGVAATMSPRGGAMGAGQGAAAPPTAEDPATLRLGAICERLGITMTAAFVGDTLGVKHARTDGTAKLYRPSDFGRICAALQTHIERVYTTSREAATA
jgi:hypothetical protein